MLTTSEWNNTNTSGKSRRDSPFPPSGFGALSTRSGKKPVIAAVNGIAFGGGFEIVINLDMIITSSKAQFGLPEVKRGVVALAGALPRLTRVVGKQRAMEMCLAGRAYNAKTMHEWGVVNAVVEGGNEEVVHEAIKWAVEIASNSPDAVIVSRQGVMMGWDGIGAQAATEKVASDWYPLIDRKENMIEGVKAFVEKRQPVWVGSKL
jgi:enoyl-CoA hydratase/carnithine racemase